MKPINRERRVFHFSGGRTSAYMVLHFFKPGDLVVFCDTGREHPDTYRFVKDFETHTQIPVVWLYSDFVKDVIIAEKMIPNRFKRKCTINLKIKKARRYLRSVGWYSYTQFIGFRHDEQNRIKEYKTKWQAVETIFPLNDFLVDKPKIINYWKQFNYDLKIESIEGNCRLCFQKGENAIIALIQNEPGIENIWVNDEENKSINPNGYTYFKGTTIRQLAKIAYASKTKYNLSDFSPKFNCSCTS